MSIRLLQRTFVDFFQKSQFIQAFDRLYLSLSGITLQEKVKKVLYLYTRYEVREQR